MKKTSDIGKMISELDKEMKTFEEKFSRVEKMRRSVKGKYKVLGVDKFSNEDWIEGEYNTPEEALGIARQKTREAMENSTGHEIATVYYAYDPEGYYLGGDAWKGE